MDEPKVKNIFLSASIPFTERNKKYINTCDVTSIRDAVIALTSVVIKDYRLIWGGHPAITPVISRVLNILEYNVSEHVMLYQSKWFVEQFPKENKDMPKVVLTEKKDSLEESLLEMRNKMIGNNEFMAAFFIGGMEGVEIEYDMFKQFHPDTPMFPIASTGAAAKILFNKHKNEYDIELENNLAYMSLFREIIKQI